MNVLKMLGVGLVLVTLVSPCLADKKEDVARLMKDLKARDIKTRIAAAEELGHIGQVKKSFTEPAVPALIDALHDPDGGVRKAAPLRGHQWELRASNRSSGREAAAPPFVGCASQFRFVTHRFNL